MNYGLEYWLCEERLKLLGEKSRDRFWAMRDAEIKLIPEKSLDAYTRDWVQRKKDPYVREMTEVLVENRSKHFGRKLARAAQLDSIRNKHLR